MATHSSILAWKIPRTEESGGVIKSRRRLSTHTVSQIHRQITGFGPQDGQSTPH